MILNRMVRKSLKVIFAERLVFQAEELQVQRPWGRKCAWLWKERRLQHGCSRGSQVESRLCKRLLATVITLMIKLMFT